MSLQMNIHICYGEKKCEALYKYEKNKNKYCENNAYYCIIINKNITYYCEVHSKKYKNIRNKLHKNPNEQDNKLKQ